MNKIQQNADRLMAELPTAVKAIIWTDVGHELAGEFDGDTLETAIDRLQVLLTLHGPTARLVTEIVHNDYETGYRLHLKVPREETDVEWVHRRALELAHVAKIEAEELATLEKLSKKYVKA